MQRWKNTPQIAVKHNVGLLLVLTPHDNDFELLHPVRPEVGCSGGFDEVSASCQPDTTHSLLSPYTTDYIISFHQTWQCTRVWQRTVGGGRNGDWKRSKGREGRRLEEDLIQKTGRSWHKDEKQSSESPQGLGSTCRHNEQSQTYPASLISTIKAIFSAQHAASSAVCESSHLSPKIKSSQKRH